MMAVDWSTKQITTFDSTPRKSVHFADTKGLALVSTFFFTAEKTSLETVREREQFGRITKAFRKLRQAKGERVNRLLNYKSPVPTREFEENIQKNNVCLEKTYCNRNGVYGRIQVKNIAYEKDVTVRSTFDSWATWEDQTANYIPGASVGDSDTFFFHIAPPVSTAEQRMEFAICYRVNGKTFWDNNFGDNYRLLYLPS
jgi:protein phosphatase 1 regulatory subunit 3A/B/C/D/E